MSFFNFGSGGKSNDIYQKGVIDKYKKNKKQKGHVFNETLYFFKDIVKENNNLKLDNYLFGKFFYFSIVTVCNLEYINNFENFLISFILNENNENVFLNHFYIYNDEVEIEKFKDKFRSFLNNKRIIIHYVKYNKKINKKMFIYHYRFDAVNKILNSNKYNKILYLDVDSLINKSVYEICDKINKSFSIYLRINMYKNNMFSNKSVQNLNDNDLNLIKNFELEKYKNMGFVMAGVFLINNDSNGKIIISKLISQRDEKYKNKLKSKYIDQIILSEIFLSKINNIDMNILDEKLFDFNLNLDSSVFMSKGKEYSTERKKWKKIVKKNKKNYIKLNIIMNFDIYYDRNKKKYIKKSIENLHKYLKIKFKNNKINDYGNLNIRNKNAIIFGVECNFKPDTKFRSIVSNNYKNVLIIEQGFINRKKYRSLSWNNIGGKASVKPKNCDSKRFKKKLNINLEELRINENGYILICGQLPWDSQVQSLNMKYNTWLNELINDLKTKTNKKIVFRYHPLYEKREGFDDITIPNDIIIDKNTSLKESIKNAYVVISYNSTCLIESLIYGCPFICFDRLSLVYDLGLNNLDKLDNLYLPSKKIRLQKLYDISYNQWSLEEFSDGTALNYMCNLLKKNRKSHLGGHVSKTNLEIGTFEYLKEKYNLKSFLDIGCGTGGMVQLANQNNLLSRGLEGDEKAIKKSKVKKLITKIDFTKEKYINQLNIKFFDLGYSSEFLEHVEEKYIKNYIMSFKKCKYIVITAAPPKWPGHHHVNCKNHEYWIRLFNKNNFYHYPYETLKCREKSTMNINGGKNKQFIKHRLLFFINIDLIDKNNFEITNEISNSIVNNTLIESNIYKELEVPESHTNQVTNTNGHLFKSTIPLVSYLL